MRLSRVLTAILPLAVLVGCAPEPMPPTAVAKRLGPPLPRFEGRWYLVESDMLLVLYYDRRATLYTPSAGYSTLPREGSKVLGSWSQAGGSATVAVGERNIALTYVSHRRKFDVLKSEHVGSWVRLNDDY